MTTTVDIPSIGSPVDDPTFDIKAILFIPDPIMFPGPRPCICGTHAPHFTNGGDFGGSTRLNQDFADVKGFVGLSFICRSLNPLPGQMTDGTSPQQQTDGLQAIAWMRDFSNLAPFLDPLGITTTGFVGIHGGSGSGMIAVWGALVGAADAALGLSPDCNYADRENLGEPGGVSQAFITKNAQYANLLDTDLVGLRAVSPVAQVNNIVSKPIDHWNGTEESMPHTQLDGVDGLRVNMQTIAPDVLYRWHLNSDQQTKNKHSYAMWEFIKVDALDWMEARAAEFTGHEPPPPPDPTGRVKVTAVITNLAPGQTLQLNVGAHDNVTGLDGPISSFEFISDRADSGGGGSLTNPTGVYALVDAVEGVITGTIGTRAWLGFSYVDGAVLPTTWRALNTTSPTSFDWSQTDAFFAACSGAGKKVGLAISMGIKDPSWIYTGGHSVTAVTVSQPNSGTIPIPWDPNYLGVIKKFIIALSQKYAANTSLAYLVVSGLGQLLDTLLVQAAADYNNLNNLAIAAGYANLVDGWTATSNGILDVWSKAFPAIPVYLALNNPVPASNGGLTAIDEFARAAINRYRARLGLMTLQLDGLTASGPDLSLNKIIHDANQTARAYRFLWPSSDPNCDPSQDPGSYVPETGLVNAATAGINIGVQMEEFYEEDILKVTNNYPTHFAAFHTALAANAI